MIALGFEIAILPTFFMKTGSEWPHVVAAILAIVIAMGAIIGLLPQGKEVPAKDVDSPRPDLSATRSFVQDSLNKALVNVMHVNGSTHQHINGRLSRLERLNRQGGYLAFYYPKSVHELGFKEYCGSLHVGENGECYSLFDIKLDGKTVVSATIVPNGHEAWKANADANYDLVCANYSGRGTEICDELDISKEVAESILAAYKG